ARGGIRVLLNGETGGCVLDENRAQSLLESALPDHCLYLRRDLVEPITLRASVDMRYQGFLLRLSICEGVIAAPSSPDRRWFKRFPLASPRMGGSLIRRGNRKISAHCRHSRRRLPPPATFHRTPGGEPAG